MDSWTQCDATDNSLRSHINLIASAYIKKTKTKITLNFALDFVLGSSEQFYVGLVLGLPKLPKAA